MNLDDRARQSAQDLHAAFAHAPIPEAPAARKSHRTLAMVGALSLVAAVVATALVLANRDDSREAQGTPPNVDSTTATDSTSVSSAVSVRGVSLDGFSHLGLTSLPAGWERVAAGGPVGSDEGDTDWQRTFTVISTPQGQVLGNSIPTDAEPISSDPAIPVRTIGGREVHFTTQSFGTTSMNQAEWVEGPTKLSLWSTSPNLRLEDVVPMVQLDAEKYVMPVPGSSASVDYRGDVAPLFAMSSPLISPAIKFDEAAGYRMSTRSAVTPSFMVGVLRGRAEGVELVDFMAQMRSGVTFASEVLGQQGVRGLLFRDNADDSPQVGEFAAVAVGDDLIVITSQGISAAVFDELLSTIAPIDNETWVSWMTETPLDAYLAELEQAASVADAPPATDVPTTS